MRLIRNKAFCLPLIVMLAYCLDSGAQSHLSKTFAFEGRTLHMDPEINSAVHDNLLAGVNKLLAQNPPEFQGIDLQRLKAKIPTVKILIATGEPLVGSGVRNDGVNFTTENFAILNYETTKKHSPTQTIIIQWHESLEALGYNDANNLLSNAIVLKSQNPSLTLAPVITEKLKAQFNEPLRTKNRVSRSEGGATSVGGGGDGETAEIKMILLYLMNKSMLNLSAEDTEKMNHFMESAMNTPLESKEFIAHYRDVKSYGRLSFGINTFDNKITILIDPKEWQPINGPISSMSDSNLELLTQIATVLRYL